MKKTKESTYYFTQQTEDAIVLYNKTTDPIVKARIFEEHIYYPFYKLAENIIHTFKFYYMDVSDVEELKHTIVTTLLEEKISKFNPSIGAKAYSYFGTIVKRWLINYNNQNFKELSRRGVLEDFENDMTDPEPYEEQDAQSLSEFMDFYIDTTYEQLETLFSKEKDKKIADAILTLFKTRQDLGIFKKKALYIYIREIVDCKTSDLTRVVKVLKDRFYDIYDKKYSIGLIHEEL